MTLCLNDPAFRAKINNNYVSIIINIITSGPYTSFLKGGYIGGVSDYGHGRMHACMHSYAVGISP